VTAKNLSMTTHDLTGANAALLLTPRRGTIEAVACGIAWVSGAYKEPLTFHDPNIVWVSVVLSNIAKGVAATISRVTLN